MRGPSAANSYHFAKNPEGQYARDITQGAVNEDAVRPYQVGDRVVYGVRRFTGTVKALGHGGVVTVTGNAGDELIHESEILPEFMLPRAAEYTG